VGGAVDPIAHMLSVTVALPWASQWYSAVGPDYYGLCWDQINGSCQWTQVSGSMLGFGGGSGVIFPPGTTLSTAVGAATCEGRNCGALGWPFNPYLATAVESFTTNEWNNLSAFYLGGPPLTCASTVCQINYMATTTSP
jgi:hypothetical protein